MEGGCTCGRVRFRLSDPPFFVNCCHCRDCQRSTGSAFALNALIEWDRMVSIGTDPEGGDRDAAAAAGRWVTCQSCGTQLWSYIPMYGAAVRFIRVGALDRGEDLAPDAHFFVRSKHPWVVVPPGVPAFEALPTASDAPLYPADAQRRLAAAMEADSARLAAMRAPG